MLGRSSQRSVLWAKARSDDWAVLLLLSLLLLEQLEVMRLPVCASSFDIREHLSTKAPYIHRVLIKGAPSLYNTPDPPGYKPIFMYLLARHGSRWPTAKRMRQINSLKHLFKSVHNPQHPWMQNWTSPVADMHYLAGDLHPLGESEMLDLAQRLRHRFPSLTDTYAPRRYPIISTQVPRAAQSASAFAIGFFSHPTHIQPLPQPQHPHQQQQHDSTNNLSNSRSSSSSSSSDTRYHNTSSTTSSSSIGIGGSGGGGYGGAYDRRRWLAQPVAINMLPKRHDPVLRFFESCRAYREHEDRAVRWLAPWMHKHWHTIVPGLEYRLEIKPGSLNAGHVDALWQLCAFEAGLDQVALGSSSNGPRSRSDSSVSDVCQLFSQADAQLLEWLEDVRLYETQGYGAAINYEIAAPLLADIASALLSAARAEAAGRRPLQRARLMFAHCETLTPLVSLMGLFQPDTREAGAMPRMPEDAELRAAIGSVDVETEQQLQAADGVDDLQLVMLSTETATAAAAPAAGPGPASQQQQQEREQGLQPSKRRKLSSTAAGGSSGGTSSSLGSNGNSRTPHDSTDSSQATALASSSHSSSSTISTHRRQQPLKHQHSLEVKGCSYKGKEPLHTSQLLPPPEGWSPGFNLDELDRVWRGGRIAPLGANLLLLLYSPADSSSSSSNGGSSSGGSSSGLDYSNHRVRLVYNEQIIPIPGCGNGLDCSLDTFLRFVVGDKTTKDFYKKHCGPEGMHTGFSGAGAGLTAQQIMYGSSQLADSSSSSSSTSSSSGSHERIWASGLDMGETKSGLEFVTADGLPLLLADELLGSQSPGNVHHLWY